MRAGILLVAVGIAVGACTGDRVALEQASDASRPHMGDFVRFERWVQRALDGVELRPASEAAREAAFAPIRNDRDVLAAGVVLAGDNRMVFPRDARFPEELEWLTVHHGTLGSVRVAEQSACDLHVPRWWRAGIPRRCVLMSRVSAADGLLDAVTVTMAFGIDGNRGGARLTAGP